MNLKDHFWSNSQLRGRLNNAWLTSWTPCPLGCGFKLKSSKIIISIAKFTVCIYTETIFAFNKIIWDHLGLKCWDPPADNPIQILIWKAEQTLLRAPVVRTTRGVGWMKHKKCSNGYWSVPKDPLPTKYQQARFSSRSSAGLFIIFNTSN